jgi:superfamily II DNA or RNA helicase
MTSQNAKAILDHKLRIHIPSLPEGALRMLTDALTVPNIEREEERKQKTWGWQNMPEFLYLYDIFENSGLVAPRGFAGQFAKGIRVYGGNIDWIDNRTFRPLEVIGGTDRNPHAWQIPAMESILVEQQGIYKAPAGSGKTATVLFAIKTLACKSIILVHTKDILWQWQERAREFLGEDYPVGQIGDGIFEISDYMTIASVSTLDSRFERLEEDGFFDEFSFVCLDECHHAQAETFNRVLDRFSAKYRIGVSATPDKTGNFALAKAVLGPIIHETKHKDVDSLQTPRVISVPTNFSFHFRGNKSPWERSNYPQMMQALIRDPVRNALIMSLVKKEEDNHCLVLSKRLEHLDILEAMAFDMDYDGHIIKLTGSETNEQRQLAREIANEEPCVLFSTLADEAVDIPRLDRLFLVFPQRNTGLITQQIGRIERTHPYKRDAIVYDFTDSKVGVLDSQGKMRRRDVYMAKGYPVRRLLVLQS